MRVAGGTLCFLATGFIKSRLKIDDSLDVFAVHGVGGMLGSLLVALFALPAFGGSGFGHALNGPAARRAGAGRRRRGRLVGDRHGRHHRAAAATVGLKLSVDEQREGLDLVIHGERAYDLA